MTDKKAVPESGKKAKSNLKPSDFVHLHNHTQYSLLDGLTKVPALLDYVQGCGMEAAAITDHGTLSGAIEFYEEATKRGIKPLIGIETYVAARTLGDKEVGKDKVYHHLILLAMNNTGYQNLMRLSTIANLEGFYYKPRIDHEVLEKYNEGIICLSGCISGEVGDQLRQGQYEKAKEIAQWYKGIFGDRYYFEIQDHGHKDHPSKWDEQVAVTEQSLKLAAELDIPGVVTSDAHYLKYADQEAHEILLCVQTGSFLSDTDRMSLKEFELFVASPEDIIARWGSEHPELITNTKALADRCNITIEFGNYHIPKFDVPKGETEKSHLDKMTFMGLVQRYGEGQEPAEKLADLKKQLRPEIVERAEYELGIIDRMGFNGYFLIVSDFITWGKNEGIVFGPGRGSGAGSIVAYGLRITELDPLRYDLLFERFLNPDRISMPDFDIDIQDTRRDEVIQYCVEKYGEDHVANIVTFGRMAARNAVRDVARVLQVPYAEADRLAKMIPPPIQGRHIPLEKSIKDDHDLKAEYENNETAKRVFDLAVQLEGTIRSHGVHAAGVVIAPDDIVKFVPLEKAQKGVVATQYPMGPIEELGLLKMDFLGLSNLTIIKNALRIVKRVYGKDIDINIIPLDDAKTLELFQRGDTTGVFQFESAGMKRYLKELRPTVFEDIIAMVALYRPGPMQWIEDFILRKHGERRIEYLHPRMENALKTTYGVIVYQEQVMQISKELAGFTGGQADTLRKGIGKKIPEVLAKLKTDFIEGAIKSSGAERALMEKFWAQLEDFAAYCFNKAHAACYALIAYQTAYLKAHYPAAFMAALMTSDFDDTDRLAIEITECKHMGIEVLPPDVDESFGEFAVVPNKNQIRFGMNAIKNVGSGAVEEILRAREDGKFEDLEDFLSRVSVRICNRKALESLVRSGALDRFGDRMILLHNMDGMLAYANRLQKQQDSGQTDLFGNLQEDIVAKPRLTLEPTPTSDRGREYLLWERELLGLYLSEHPLQLFEKFLEEQTVSIQSLTPDHDGKSVTVGGSITDVREITTKNGQKMAFVKLEDTTKELELILFPNSYQKTLGLWERDKVVLVQGKINTKGRDGSQTDEVKVMVDEAREITPQQAGAYVTTGKKIKAPKPGNKKKTVVATRVPEPSITVAPPERVYVKLLNSDNQQTLLTLKQTLDKFSGNTDVVLVLGDGASKQIIKLPTGIDKSSDGISQLEELVGTENLVIR